jgi:hypothetical protein
MTFYRIGKNDSMAIQAETAAAAAEEGNSNNSNSAHQQ